MKASAGYTTKNIHYSLMMLDRLCLARGEQDVGITVALSDAWCAKRPNESMGTLANRVMYLKAFSAFLNDLGYLSHVPYPVRRPQKDFVPYIFTEQQMAAIFSAADTLASDHNPRSTGSAIPCLLRFLYATALRVGEAVSIAVEDVDLKTQVAVVRDSKNGKDRLMPFSESTKDVLTQYRKTIGFSQDEGDPFFVRDNGLRCEPPQVYKWFRKVLFIAGIPHSGKGPRVHDVRHSATVHALVKMARDKMDLYCALPILSRYLGHQSLQATDFYVRLTASVYPELVGDVGSLCSYIFPEVAHEKAY
jgi:integrase